MDLTWSDPSEAVNSARAPLSPATAGAATGFAAGVVALGIVHLLASDSLGTYVGDASQARGVHVGIGWLLAYATTASFGGLAGAAFAFVTRYLERYVPLLIWALVFFVSLGMLLVAASEPAREMSLPILLGSAVFGVVVSFSLPIRRER